MVIVSHWLIMLLAAFVAELGDILPSFCWKSKTDLTPVGMQGLSLPGLLGFAIEERELPLLASPLRFK